MNDGIFNEGWIGEALEGSNWGLILGTVPKNVLEENNKQLLSGQTSLSLRFEPGIAGMRNSTATHSITKFDFISFVLFLVNINDVTKINLLWDIAPYSVLHHYVSEEPTASIYREDACSRSLRNVSNDLISYVMSYLRRPLSSLSPRENFQSRILVIAECKVTWPAIHNCTFAMKFPWDVEK
jgi:hypothetical protein